MGLMDGATYETIWDLIRNRPVIEEQVKYGCVPESIRNAEKWAKIYNQPVRIAIQKIDQKNDVDHAQAEAWDGNKWIPLTAHHNEKGGLMDVQPWSRHFDVEPYRYVDIETFKKEQQGNY